MFAALDDVNRRLRQLEQRLHQQPVLGSVRELSEAVGVIKHCAPKLESVRVALREAPCKDGVIRDMSHADADLYQCEHTFVFEQACACYRFLLSKRDMTSLNRSVRSQLNQYMMKYNMMNSEQGRELAVLVRNMLEQVSEME